MLKKFNWFSAVLILITALLYAACNKENHGVGLEIQPPGDKLNVFSTDTTSVIAYSQVVDSVKTDETSVSLLGSLLDPVFGKSTAIFIPS
jgi:predicted small secreted protein